VKGVPRSVAEFLGSGRIAVAGVSRNPAQAANAVYRKLRDAGHEVFPVNPNAGEVEGVRCYLDIGSIPGSIEGVLIASHPRVLVAWTAKARSPLMARAAVIAHALPRRGAS
jgi:predicted CoA-binding protein